MAIAKVAITQQCCRWVTAMVVAIATVSTPTASVAQRDLIPIDGSDEKIQFLFDIVYHPQRDPAPFRLQNSAEVEAYQLIRTILRTGTTIYVRRQQDGNYGSYSFSQDRLVLRPRALAHWPIFIETLRHEGWHVVQACFAAKQDLDSLVPVGMRVNPRTVADLYNKSGYHPADIPIEAEAFEAERLPNMTLEGLQRECADWLNRPSKD
ncbi:hypothetical protein BRW62_06255 [Parathermosynechococcus lividus PCC 6715]|uniref:Uncharacterized protein n=1 Tax=Parathermosynechococcus lividus PCC 6715 TaxID=1917166 RepID=A0A2D2Q2B9_PARLV|nr:hypothetical protein [Thermostichus lividus]ATS18417.1 hypothetical protein BRW62_06255 [Thermostichus lividus PCC 6715]